VGSVNGSERVLGTFELRGTLGRGAMAVVWRAYDTSLDREVAIKEPSLPPGGDDDVRAEFARRFVREARAAARLNHPGIVTIHSASLDEGRPLIVMELVEGSTLRHILDAQTLTAAQTYALFEQLLAATAFAHERDVIHRDLKPDNVFVTPSGTVKLADFGIAHLGGAGTTLTTAGALLGTPAYMAPEQIRGEPVDAHADVFALGVVAYECLAGRNPFGCSSSSHYAAIFHRILDEPVPPLEPADPAAATLVGVVLRALEKDRDERFESAADMLAAWRAAFPESVDARAELSGLSSGAVESAASHATEVQTAAIAEGVQVQAHDDAATQFAVPPVAAVPAAGVSKLAGATRARTRRRLLVAVAVAACVAAIAVGALWASGHRWPFTGGGGTTDAPTKSPSSSPSAGVSRSEMRSYLETLGSIMADASSGHLRIGDIMEAFYAGTISGKNAKREVREVIKMRNGTIDRLAHLDVPEDLRAESCADGFQRAMLSSLTADQRCMDVIDGYRPKYSEASANRIAGSDKNEFLAEYNRLAKDHGLRHDWTKDDI
jgi:hypothetical protein